MAIPSKPRLITIEITVPTVGQKRVKPCVYLSPMAQPTSNRPATIRMTHDMTLQDGGKRKPLATLLKSET